MAHIYKRKSSKYYNIRFRRMENGIVEEKQFSLKTSNKRIAQQLETRLLADQQLGKINVYQSFNFDSWKNQDTETSSNRLLSHLIQQFLDEATHIVDKTKKHYKMVLNLFNESVGSTMMTDLLRIEDITKFVFKPTYSIATQNNYLRHLKTFFKWLEKQGHGKNLTADIKPKKVPETLKDQIISEDELNHVVKTNRDYILVQESKKLVNYDKQRQLWFGPLITTAFYTGLRQSELLDLKWKHIDFDGRQVSVVSGKGGKSRTTVLLNPALKVLEKWAEISTSGNERFVFESVKSMPNNSIRMTNRTVSRVFKDFVTLTELSDSIHFHSLRHSCATYLLKAGFSVHEVQKMLGHSSISVTERYLHLVPEDLTEKARKLGLI